MKRGNTSMNNKNISLYFYYTILRQETNKETKIHQVQLHAPNPHAPNILRNTF